MLNDNGESLEILLCKQTKTHLQHFHQTNNIPATTID